MENIAEKKSVTEIKDFLKQYNFWIVCFFCMLFAVCSIWVRPYFLIFYLITVGVSCLFYDVNKVLGLCFVFLFFARPLNYFHGVVLFVAALLAVCVKELVLKRLKLTKDLIVPVVIICTYVVLFFSIDFNPARLEAIFNTIFPLLFALELFFLRSQVKISKIFKYMSMVFVISCILAFLAYKTGGYDYVYHIDDKGVARFMGFLSHENALAIWAAILLSMLVFFFFNKKIGFVGFVGFAVSLCVVGVMTKSKTFLVIMLVIGVIFLAVNFKRNWKVGLLFTLLLLFVFGACVVVVPNKMIQYFQRFVMYSGGEDRSFLDIITTGRVGIWTHYLGVWTETPFSIVFGHGGTFVTDWVLGSHNTFIEVLVYYGLFGILLDLVFFVYLTICLSKERKISFVNFIPLIAVILFSMVEVLSRNRAMLIVLASFILSNGDKIKQEKVADNNIVGKFVSEDLISVIIPVYKVEKYLARCVESVMNQTYKNLEIILVDDGSPDECGKMCDEFAKRDERIKVIHKQNGGVSSARNAGLDVCTGKYIAFVDSDDYIDQTMYESLWKKMKSEDSSISFCRYREVTDKKETAVYETALEKFCLTGDLKFMFNQSSLIGYDDDGKTIGKYVGGYIWRSLFERNLIKNIRFDEKVWYAEDLLFLAESLCKGKYKISFVDECLYNYYIRQESQTHDGVSKDKAYGDKFVGNKLGYIEKIKSILSGTEFEKHVEGMYFYGYSTILTKKYVDGVDVDLDKVSAWKTKERYKGNQKYVYGIKFKVRNFLIYKNKMKLFKLFKSIA